MRGLQGVHGIFGDLVVAAGAAADDLGVELGPLGEAVPRAGVVHHDAFAGGGEGEERFAVGGGVEEFPIHADDGDVGAGEFGGRLVAVFGVVHRVAGGAENGAVSLAEEFAELVRAPAADDQDAGLAGFPDDRRGFGEHRIAAAAGFGSEVGKGGGSGGGHGRRGGFRVGGEVGDDVAETGGAEIFEAFGHQRAAGVFARRDVGGFDFGVAALVAHDERGGGFGNDHAGKRLTFFRGDVPLPEIRFHLAIGVDDRGEQISGRVGADAGEGRADIAEADVTKFVADGASGGVERAAVGDVAGLLHVGQEFRDQIVFGFRGRVGGAEDDEGFAGDSGGRVLAEAGDVGGPEGGGAEAVGADCGNEGEGGFLTFQDLFEDRRGLRLDEGVNEHVDGFAAGELADGGDERGLDGVGGRGIAEKNTDFREGRGAMGRERDEGGGDVGARGVGGVGVGEIGEDAAGGGGHGGGECAGGIPLGGDTEGGGGGVGCGEEGFQGGGEGRLAGARRHGGRG